MTKTPQKIETEGPDLFHVWPIIRKGRTWANYSFDVDGWARPLAPKKRAKVKAGKAFKWTFGTGFRDEPSSPQAGIRAIRLVEPAATEAFRWKVVQLQKAHWEERSRMLEILKTRFGGKASFFQSTGYRKTIEVGSRGLDAYWSDAPSEGDPLEQIANVPMLEEAAFAVQFHWLCHESNRLWWLRRVLDSLIHRIADLHLPRPIEAAAFGRLVLNGRAYLFEWTGHTPEEYGGRYGSWKLVGMPETLTVTVELE